MPFIFPFLSFLFFFVTPFVISSYIASYLWNVSVSCFLLLLLSYSPLVSPSFIPPRSVILPSFFLPDGATQPHEESAETFASSRIWLRNNWFTWGRKEGRRTRRITEDKCDDLPDSTFSFSFLSYFSSLARIYVSFLYCHDYIFLSGVVIKQGLKTYHENMYLLNEIAFVSLLDTTEVY